MLYKRLTKEEVNALPDGAEVFVTTLGGGWAWCEVSETRTRCMKLGNALIDDEDGYFHYKSMDTDAWELIVEVKVTVSNALDIFTKL